MKFTRRKLAATVALTVLIPTVIWFALTRFGLIPQPGDPLFPPFQLSDRLSQLEIEQRGDEFVAIFGAEGQREELSERDFLEEVYRRQQANGSVAERSVFAALDITSWTGLLWLGFGVLAQLVFTARFIVQWLASERARSSVIPPAFWWLSLVGSTMLVIYFIWRKEPIGILGQATGWFVYVRNLWFIYVGSVEEET